MKGGHNIKGATDHKKSGTYRSDRHAGRLETAAKVVNTIPAPPATFDKRHRDKWNEVCRHVFELGVLSEPDLSLIEAFVRRWFLWQDAMKGIAEEGFIITVETEKGVKQIKNPLLHVANESEKLFIGIADRLGFSPKARMSIKTQQKSPEDPLEKFLGGRGN